MQRDVRLRPRGALRNSIPLILGSAGRAGRAPHVTRVREIIEEIAHGQGLQSRMAIIHPEQDEVYAFEKPPRASSICWVLRGVMADNSLSLVCGRIDVILAV